MKLTTMKKKNKDDVGLLLSKLDRKQLEDFIRKECLNNRHLRDRFLALGAGTLFMPDPEDYASRVLDLIEKYGGRHGYIDYDTTSDFYVDVIRIIDEADGAMEKGQWDVAVAVLTGISSVADDILNSGDDSDGDLGELVNECFEKWHKLCLNESLPEEIKSDIYELAVSKFDDKDLREWDWWWDWMQMAIDLADTPEKQNRVFKSLDEIKPKGDDWRSKYEAETAQKYKLELMSHYNSEEDQIKFMYDNVANPDIRKRLIQLFWDKSDYDEVLRLAKEGEAHDVNYAGLVENWREWQYRVYREIGDKHNQLQLARYFFFGRFRWSTDELSMESMYLVLKTLIPQNEWQQYVETLIVEAQRKGEITQLLYIYEQEKRWSDYMDYIRESNNKFVIDDAPEEVKKLYRDEIIKLYASEVRNFFRRASDRKSYRGGVRLLRNLINYGGEKEAMQIVAEQKARTPRRPALIEELSKL